MCVIVLCHPRSTAATGRKIQAEVASGWHVYIVSRARSSAPSSDRWARRLRKDNGGPGQMTDTSTAGFRHLYELVSVFSVVSANVQLSYVSQIGVEI